jgi:uncharacterized membrane protein
MTTIRPISFVALLAVSLLVGGCSTPDPMGPRPDASSDGPAFLDARADAPRVDAVAVPADTASPDTGGASDGALPVGFFPCNVEKAMKAKCHTCHTDPPMNGAPFSLLEYADTQADYGQGLKIWEVMKRAIESDFMPLACSPTGPLTPEEKTTMLTWLGDGAPAAPTKCSMF